jgi:hypothetical protein
MKMTLGLADVSAAITTPGNASRKTEISFMVTPEPLLRLENLRIVVEYIA